MTQATRLWSRNNRISFVFLFYLIDYLSTTTTAAAIPIFSTTTCVSQWSSWGVAVCTPNSCGACGVLTQNRTCTSAASGCNCNGTTTQTNGTACNFQVCSYPSPTCCSGYHVAAVDGQFQCVAIITVTSTTSTTTATVATTATTSNMTTTTIATTLTTANMTTTSTSNITTTTTSTTTVAQTNASITTTTTATTTTTTTNTTTTPTTATTTLTTISSTCPPNGTWSAWGMATCSDSCGACGTWQRNRTCTSAAVNGCPCAGFNIKSSVTVCNTGICAFPRPVCCTGYISAASNGMFICVPATTITTTTPTSMTSLTTLSGSTTTAGVSTTATVMVSSTTAGTNATIGSSTTSGSSTTTATTISSSTTPESNTTTISSTTSGNTNTASTTASSTTSVDTSTTGSTSSSSTTIVTTPTGTTTSAGITTVSTTGTTTSVSSTTASTTSTASTTTSSTSVSTTSTLSTTTTTIKACQNCVNLELLDVENVTQYSTPSLSNPVVSGGCLIATITCTTNDGVTPAEFQFNNGSFLIFGLVTPLTVVVDCKSDNTWEVTNSLGQKQDLSNYSCIDTSLPT